MGRIIFLLFSLCYLAMTSHAFDSPQAYWTSKLPNTPIPQLIKDSLVTPDADLTLQPSTARKFLGSKNDKATLKTIIEAYIGTHGNKRFLSSISNNHLSHHKKRLGEIESLVPTNPTLFSNDLKDSLVLTNPTLFYSNKQLETIESNDLKDSLVLTNPTLFYSNKQLETIESNDLKDSLVLTNPTLFYSNKQLETIESSMESNDLEESSIPTNQLFLYPNNGQHEGVTMHNHDVGTKAEEGHVVFVEEDLYLGKTFKLHFKKGTNKSPFLPREVAVKIPFASQTLQDTLNLVSVSPNSIQSKVISEKMAICEEPAIEGLEKQCVTSLESMVDYVVSSLGENVQTVFTKVDQDYPKMEYQVTQVKRLTKNDHETIACHKMEYPYALYFCHGTLTIRPYMVTLLAKDGTEIKAIASCHKETSDPMKSFMKNVLKVMPGSARICHIITTPDNLFWILN